MHEWSLKLKSTFRSATIQLEQDINDSLHKNADTTSHKTADSTKKDFTHDQLRKKLLDVMDVYVLWLQHKFTE